MARVHGGVRRTLPVRMSFWCRANTPERCSSIAWTCATVVLSGSSEDSSYTAAPCFTDSDTIAYVMPLCLSGRWLSQCRNSSQSIHTSYHLVHTAHNSHHMVHTAYAGTRAPSNKYRQAQALVRCGCAGGITPPCFLPSSCLLSRPHSAPAVPYASRVPLPLPAAASSPTPPSAPCAVPVQSYISRASPAPKTPCRRLHLCGTPNTAALPPLPMGASTSDALTPRHPHRQALGLPQPLVMLNLLPPIGSRCRRFSNGSFNPSILLHSRRPLVPSSSSRSLKTFFRATYRR